MELLETEQQPNAPAASHAPLASSPHPKLFHLEMTSPLATTEPFLLLFQVTLPQGNDCEAGQTQAEKAD